MAMQVTPFTKMYLDLPCVALSMARELIQVLINRLMAECIDYKAVFCTKNPFSEAISQEPVQITPPNSDMATMTTRGQFCQMDTPTFRHKVRLAARATQAPQNGSETGFVANTHRFHTLSNNLATKKDRLTSLHLLSELLSPAAPLLPPFLALLPSPHPPTRFQHLLETISTLYSQDMTC